MTTDDWPERRRRTLPLAVVELLLAAGMVLRGLHDLSDTSLSVVLVCGILTGLASLSLFAISIRSYRARTRP